MITINDEVKVGNLKLANRMVMPPMATWKQTDNGEIPDELVKYYADRAGSLGLIIMEFAYISEEGKTRPGQLSIAKDEDIHGLRKIVDAVHEKGNTKIFAQINHAGLASGYEVKDQQDIHRIIKAFGNAARRAKNAGFDGVEIHAAHGYLLNQFFSPLSNKRDDEYTYKTMLGRTRLTKEVIEEVRKSVGNDYPISLRFGGCDYQDGGSTIDDAAQAASIYEQAGVDMISISGGMNGFMIKGVTAPGWFAEMSKAVKTVVNIPVLVTGGITKKLIGEKILNSDGADLIGVGRPLLKKYNETISEFLD